MASYHAPREWEDQVQWLAQSLHGRSSWRFSIVLLGALFASGRRVVASWVRAAGVSHDFQGFYFFLQSVGRRWKELGIRLLVLLLPILKGQQRVLLAIDAPPPNATDRVCRERASITIRRLVPAAMRFATDMSG